MFSNNLNNRSYRLFSLPQQERTPLHGIQCSLSKLNLKNSSSRFRDLLLLLNLPAPPIPSDKAHLLTTTQAWGGSTTRHLSAEASTTSQPSPSSPVQHSKAPGNSKKNQNYGAYLGGFQNYHFIHHITTTCTSSGSNHSPGLSSAHLSCFPLHLFIFSFPHTKRGVSGMR